MFPYLAIATELKALGHTPVVCSCPYYQGLVEQEGVEFRPLRPDVQPDNTTLLERIMDPQRGSEVIIRELIVANLRPSYDDITAAVDGADLLLSHPITFAAPLVAAKRGLPWLASVLAPLSFFSLHDFPALPNAPQIVRLTRLTPWAGRALLALARRITGRWVAPVVAMRAELGLPPAGDPLYEGQFSPHGNLALFSRALGDAQPDWPARTTVTGFPFFNRAIPMPARAERVPRRRRAADRVHAGLGGGQRRRLVLRRERQGGGDARSARGAAGRRQSRQPAGVPSHRERSRWTGRRTTRCFRAHRWSCIRAALAPPGRRCAAGGPS